MTVFLGKTTTPYVPTAVVKEHMPEVVKIPSKIPGFVECCAAISYCWRSL